MNKLGVKDIRKARRSGLSKYSEIPNSSRVD
nr:MAG TPA: hypothetical protein [Caudoviricetes sp.]